MTSRNVALLSGHGRSRGLSNTTNLPTNINYKTKDGDTLSQLDSTSAHRQDLSPSELAPKREPSKALLNDDWRNKWRPDGAKSVRFPAELNSKARITEASSKGDKKKLRIDTVMANLSLNDKTSHIIYPRTSVDPDFILSAPATKKEYNFAGEQNHDLESDEETGADLSSTDALQISFGPKQLVHLNAITPATEHGFRQMGLSRILEISCSSNPAHPTFGQPETSSVSSSDKSGLSSAIPITSDEETSSRSMNVQFPDAEIRQIKNAKKNQFKPIADWKEADESMQNLLAKLKISSTAGLPIETERGEYGKISQGGRKGAATIEVLEDPSIQSIQLNDKTHMGPSPRGTRNEIQEKRKFNALLAKLNKIPASRTQINDPAVISMKPASCITVTGKVAGGTERRLSNDSAISGTCVPPPQKEISQKSSTLNPTASEFSCSIDEQKQKIQQRMSFDIGSRSKFNRPSVIGLFEEPVPDTPVATDYGFNHALLERLASLEVQIDQLSELHALQAQKHAIIQQLNISSSFNGLAAQQSSNLPGSNGLYPQAPMLPPDDNRYPESRGFVPSMGSAPLLANNMHGLPAPVVSATPFNGALLSRVPPSGLFHNFSNGAPEALPSGFSFPGIHVNPPLMPAPGIPQVKMQGPTTGPQPVGLVPTPVYMSNGTLGPKPVRKPKGPARPGDPIWAKSQQEYEAYLEWRRANDPEYHQQCKERQSKRADRIKNGLREKVANSSDRSNAAIEIKAPESDAFANIPSSAVEIKAPKEGLNLG